MTATTADPFLAAILADPFDDQPRLVYADYLDEQGDPRGEFIRVQCELAKPQHEKCNLQCALRRRERELFELRPADEPNIHCVDRWLSTPQLSVCTRGYSGPHVCYPIIPPHGATPFDIVIRRGFPDAITLPRATLLGGPCARCGHTAIRGEVCTEDPPDPRTGISRASVKRCPTCHGTGRTPVIAADLFRAAPITAVRLSDREPDNFAGGHRHWGQGHGHRSLLPTELFCRLRGQGECGHYCNPTPAAAHAALSRAVVDHCRELAGLPPLPWPTPV